MPLSSYLPPHLVRRIAEDPLPRPPYASRAQAALLMSDIVGFTALTETLEAAGREGAEEIAAIVSATFRPAIDAIRRQHGSIVSFGGDALFAAFFGKRPVHRARAAAEDIRRTFAARAASRIAHAPPLAVAQAIHFGTVVELDLGREATRHHLVAGACVEALAQLEGRARAGEILLSRAARAQARAEPWRPGAAPQRRSTVARAAIETYLPGALRAHLASGRGRNFKGEYRIASVLFLETRGRGLAALQRFYLALEDALGCYGGGLLKSDLSPEGTKWLCVFGIPAAHEDDPTRAARAALDVMRAQRGLAARAAIHAGTLVNIEIGTPTRMSFDVMGDVVNTAARAMARASWGECVLTGAVRPLCPGIATEPRGRHVVKGKEKPIETHALVGIAAAAAEIQVSAPLVGRAAELAVLRDALEAGRRGQGRAIAIGGEAGLGKSRLKWEAVKLATGYDIAEGRAISFSGMAYWAVAQLVRGLCRISAAAAASEALATLSREAVALALDEPARHHLAEVLGYRYEGSPLASLAAREIRQRNVEALSALLSARARRAPQLWVLEDLHLADELSREVLQALARGVAGRAAVLMLLYRPGYEPPPEAVRIPLRELPSEDLARIATSLMGGTGERAAERLAGLIAGRAEGNPFYVEEMVRHLMETGLLTRDAGGWRLAREPREDELPNSIGALIAARLDELSPDARRTASVGAVIGRSFLFELLAHFPDVNAVAAAGVKELLSREIVFEKEREPHLEYIFKHALTRDVAYGTILKRRRRLLHRQVAEAIDLLFSDERDAYLPMLGQHWEQAGMAMKARPCYLGAARRTKQRFAPLEAEALYRRYLALVHVPTKESIAARNELGSGPYRILARGQEAKAEHARARDEAQALGDAEARDESITGMANASWMLGEMEQARALFLEAHAGAVSRRDVHAEGAAVGGLAGIAKEQGRFDEAIELDRRAIELHRKSRNRSGEASVHNNLAVLLMEQGRVSEALAEYDAAALLYRETADRRNLGIVLTNVGSIHHNHGSAADALRCYREAMALFTDVGERAALANALSNQAELLRDMGDFDESRRLYERALDLARETGIRRSEGWLLCTFGSFKRLVDGDLDAAERMIEEAIRILQDLDDTVLLCSACIFAGHIQLARCQSCRKQAECARVQLARLGATPESPLERSIRWLERAEEALARGEALYRGSHRDQLPAALREHIERAEPGAVRSGGLHYDE